MNPLLRASKTPQLRKGARSVPSHDAASTGFHVAGSGTDRGEADVGGWQLPRDPQVCSRSGAERLKHWLQPGARRPALSNPPGHGDLPFASQQP